MKGATRKEIEDLTEMLRGEDGGSREQKKQGSVLGFVDDHMWSLPYCTHI